MEPPAIIARDTGDHGPANAKARLVAMIVAAIRAADDPRDVPARRRSALSENLTAGRGKEIRIVP